MSWQCIDSVCSTLVVFRVLLTGEVDGHVQQFSVTNDNQSSMVDLTYESECRQDEGCCGVYYNAEGPVSRPSLLDSQGQTIAGA